MALSKSQPQCLPWTAYNQFFKLNKVQENGNFVVQCSLCRSISKTLSVSKSSPSNMKLHIERKHAYHLPALMKSIEEVKTKRKQSILTDPSCSDDQGVSFNKQAKLKECFDGSVRSSTKEELEDTLINWIIDGMHCFSEVERPTFIALWQKLTNKKLMCRKTLMSKITKMFEENKKKGYGRTKNIDHVCTAADSWTCGRKAYLGVTCHYVDPETLERKTVGLACRRIKGRHTNDVLAKELNNIFFEFKIQNKNIMTITDNGSNFVKAFSVFGPELDNETIESCDEEPAEEDDVVFIQLTEELDNLLFDMNHIHLPCHRRCAAHTINLIAVKDTEKALKNDSKYKKAFRSTFAKCQALWNKSRMSSLSADIITEKLGRHLIVPNTTRWNSIYDSADLLSSLFKNKEEAMHCVCDQLGLTRFSTQEIQFLQEYVEVMKPVAKALDILQGETNVSIGYLLPTLMKLKEHINKVKSKPLDICDALANSILEGISKRFDNDFENNELILAAAFHPRFKLNWITDASRVIETKALMRQCILKISPTAASCTPPEKAPDDFDGFFDFMPPKEKQEISGEEELDRFLREGLDSFKSLSTYNYRRKLSIKYNTGLPSSASVERLFSCGKELYGTKRSRMTDNNFEKQLLLKFNVFKKTKD